MFNTLPASYASICPRANPEITRQMPQINYAWCFYWTASHLLQKLQSNFFQVSCASDLSLDTSTESAYKHIHTLIGDFWAAFRLCFKASPGAKPFIWKLVLFTCKWVKICVNKTNFHMKGFAVGLNATWKSPIILCAALKKCVKYENCLCKRNLWTS